VREDLFFLPSTSTFHHIWERGVLLVHTDTCNSGIARRLTFSFKKKRGSLHNSIQYLYLTIFHSPSLQCTPLTDIIRRRRFRFRFVSLQGLMFSWSWQHQEYCKVALSKHCQLYTVGQPSHVFCCPVEFHTENQNVYHFLECSTSTGEQTICILHLNSL
jgi:hypothetical protein